jgi:phosphate transport system substrate-binding protein
MKKSVVVLSCCLLILSCSQKKAKSYKLRVKGSESLYDTFVALKFEFEKNQDSIKLLLEGGGSRTGLVAIHLERPILDYPLIGFRSTHYSVLIMG